MLVFGCMVVVLGLFWMEWFGYIFFICVELWWGVDGEGGYVVCVFFDCEEVVFFIFWDGSVLKKVLFFYEFLEIVEWFLLLEMDFLSRC